VHYRDYRQHFENFAVFVKINFENFVFFSIKNFEATKKNIIFARSKTVSYGT
jgi:hypothetical protein